MAGHIICFVSFRFVSFRFVSFRFDLFRFVSICFVSFRFVSFRFDLFRFVPFRFCFVSHFTGTRTFVVYQFMTSESWYFYRKIVDIGNGFIFNTIIIASLFWFFLIYYFPFSAIWKFFFLLFLVYKRITMWNVYLVNRFSMTPFLMTVSCINFLKQSNSTKAGGRVWISKL